MCYHRKYACNSHEIQQLRLSLKSVQNQYGAVVNQNRQLQAELRPFKQECFKGLSNEEIARMAKKYIEMKGVINMKYEEMPKFLQALGVILLSPFWIPALMVCTIASIYERSDKDAK